LEGKDNIAGVMKGFLIYPYIPLRGLWDCENRKICNYFEKRGKLIRQNNFQEQI